MSSLKNNFKKGVNKFGYYDKRYYLWCIEANEINNSLKNSAMTYIVITHEEIDSNYDLTGRMKNTLHRTPAIDSNDIDRWVFSWAKEWRYATEQEISIGNAEYFNPYVGEVNESAPYD